MGKLLPHPPYTWNIGQCTITINCIPPNGPIIMIDQSRSQSHFFRYMFKEHSLCAYLNMYSNSSVHDPINYIYNCIQPLCIYFILNLNELERNYKSFSYAFTQANLHNFLKM